MISTNSKDITNPNEGYDAYSSNFAIWTNTINTVEPNTKPRTWYKWFKNRIRQYMTMEILFSITLILMLYRLQTISSQNDRLSEMVNSRFGIMERKLESFVSGKPNQDNYQFESTKPLEQKIADLLKNMKLTTQKSTDEIEPIVLHNNQSTYKAEESTFTVPIPKELFLFNAADFLKGASVDSVHSSSSSLNPIIGYDQSSLVLLDRPQPPAEKAWCTDAKNPVLTINLAKYIKPISVSYQHSKWNGTIPNGAPKTYDVVACLDFYCEKWTPLVSNCQYSRYKSNEQMCNISSHLDVPSIGKVQFRFRENYGDTKMTCVHLVRVYGETTTPPKIEEKNLKSEEICTDLRWYYHNSNFRYTLATSQFESTKPLKQSIANVLMNTKFPTQKSTDKVELIILHNSQSTSKTEDIPLKVSIQNELFRFNAADFLKGTSVDIAHSSRSSLKPEIGYDQTNLVLLDRPQPPSDKAWCSNAEHSVLTINLAKSIKPISVSYQHSKWHGTIPNGAPKTYDVVGCLDCNGEDWEPLVSNCKYSQYVSNEPEQMCNISSYREFPIRKVQFRFLKNYGDTKMTCVHLVRVYGETKTPAKMEETNLESEERCANLRWYYHNSFFRYNWARKSCTVLFQNQCCSDCPECCQECLIKDYNGETFLAFGLPTIAIYTYLCYLYYYLYFWDISVFWPDV